MATVDAVKKFVEHAVRVERVLRESRITGNAGRVLFVLTLAEKGLGIPQMDAVAAMALPKDVVSKLVRSLVEAGLLTQERMGGNSRIKQVAITESGRALLFRVKAALNPARPAKKEPEEGYSQQYFTDPLTGLSLRPH